MKRNPLLSVCASILSTIVLVPWSSPAWGTPGARVTGDIESLTEPQFLDRIERWAPRFEELQARVEGARAAIVGAKALPNPSLSYDREEVFPPGGSLPENYLRSEFPIDVSGRRSRRIRAAEAAADASSLASEKDRLDLVLDALDFYRDSAVARLEVDTLRTDRDALARLKDIIGTRVAAGEASAYDRDRLEIDLTAYDERLAEAETKLDVSRRSLGRLIGEASASFDASDALSIPAPPQLTADAITQLVESRADYRSARERVRQSELELSVAQRAWVPDLSLSAGWKSSDTGTTTADGYTAGLGVSIPLFDQGQAARAVARARKHEAEAQLKLLGWQIESEIETAVAELSRLIERARRFEQDQLPRLDRLTRRADVSYREGEHSVFDLLDAHRTARDTRLRALALRREVKHAEVRLWRALGQRPVDGAAQ